jgi:hypothetical protein
MGIKRNPIGKSYRITFNKIHQRFSKILGSDTGAGSDQSRIRD